MEDSGDSSWSESLRRKKQYDTKCRGPSPRKEGSTTLELCKHARSPNSKNPRPAKAGPDPERARANLLTNVLNCFKPILPQLDIMNNRFLHLGQEEECKCPRDSTTSVAEVGINLFTCNCTFNPSQTTERQTPPHRADSTDIIYQPAQAPRASDTVMIVLDKSAEQSDATSRPTSSDSDLSAQSSASSVTSDESLFSIHTIDTKYSGSHSQSSRDQTITLSNQTNDSRSHCQCAEDQPFSNSNLAKNSKVKTKIHSHTYYTATSTIPPSYTSYVQQALYLRHPNNKPEIYRAQPIACHNNFSLAPDIQSEYQTNRLVCAKIQTEVESIIKHHASRFVHQTVDLLSHKRHRCRSRRDESDGNITDATEESCSQDEEHSDTIQIELGDFSSDSDARHCSSESLSDTESLCCTCRCDSWTCYSAHAHRMSSQQEEHRRMQDKGASHRQEMKRIEQVSRGTPHGQKGRFRRQRNEGAPQREHEICKCQRNGEVARDTPSRQKRVCKRDKTEKVSRDVPQKEHGICTCQRTKEVARSKQKRSKEVTQGKPKVIHTPGGPCGLNSERAEGPPCVVELDGRSESESSVFKETSESSHPARYLADKRRRHDGADAEAHPRPSTPLDTSSVLLTTSTCEDNRRSAATLIRPAQQRPELLLRSRRKTQSCVLPRNLVVNFKRRPYTMMSRTQRQRNIFCSTMRRQQEPWRRDIMECFQTQVTLRLQSAVRRKRDQAARDRNIREICNKSKPTNATEANTGDGRRVGILNCETTISCQNKTTLFFSNENENNFLQCTQSYSNTENDENEMFCEEVNSDTVNKVSKILAVESFLKRTANNKDPNVHGEHSRKHMDKANELNGQLTGRINDAISRIELATRERQQQIKNRLEKIFEGARHLKNLEKLCNTCEPKIGDQKKFIEHTIQKGKVTVLHNVINLDKLASPTDVSNTHACSSKETHNETVTEYPFHYREEAGPSRVTERLNTPTPSDHRAVRRKMKSTLLSNPVQNINKAKNKIKNQIRMFRNLRIKELSPRVSTSGEDIRVLANLRAMILAENFEVGCLFIEYKMHREFYYFPIPVRHLLSRIKLKRGIEYKIKRKIKIKKIKLKISMKNVQLLESNKMSNVFVQFHLDDFLCRLCTVKQTLRSAMRENEKYTMSISLNENVVNMNTLQPFTMLSVNNHFIKLSVDKCHLDLRRRTTIHISLKHVIKCDNIHLQVRPIEVMNIDTEAIVLKAISFIGGDSTVKNIFGYMKHNQFDLTTKRKINKVDLGDKNEVECSCSDIEKVISSSTNITETLLQKISCEKAIFVLSKEKMLNEEERNKDKNLQKSNNITIPSQEVLKLSSDMLDDKDKSQKLKTQQTNNNTGDFEEISKYSIKKEEHVGGGTFVNDLSQNTISSDMRSEVMLRDTNLGTSSSHLLLLSEHSELSQCVSWSKFHQVQIEIPSNEMDKDKYSSTLTINSTNSNTMDTNMLKSNIHRLFSLSKSEIKFSSADLRDYLQVCPEQKEDTEDARLPKESSSVTLTQEESIIIVDKTNFNTKHSESSIGNLEKKEIEENRNEERLSNFNRDLVVEKEKRYESVDNNSEPQNKLKEIYQEVDPILCTTKNMNSQFQDEAIFEEQKTVKLKIILKMDDPFKLQNALQSLLSTETQNSADQCDTKISECSEKKEQSTVSESLSSGTEGSSDSSNGMNLDVDLDPMNLFENEGQRILETYEHTLETLSEKTERSSSASTGLSTLASTLSEFRKTLCSDLTNYIECIESQFSFTVELRETSHQIMKDCKDKINKNGFTFRSNKISLKVSGKIRIHTGTHCYVTKPFFASRKQRNPSKRKRSELTEEMKKEKFDNVGVDVRNSFDMQHVEHLVDNSKTADLQFHTDSIESKILEYSSGNSAETIQPRKLVEHSTNSSIVSTSDMTDIMGVTFESLKSSHMIESASFKSLSQSKVFGYSITDDAVLGPVTGELNVNTDSQKRIPKSLTFMTIDCCEDINQQQNSRTRNINNIVEQVTYQSTQSLIPNESPSEDLPTDDSKVEPQVDNSQVKKQPFRHKNSMKYSKRRKLRKVSEVSKPPVSNLSLSMTESLVIQSSKSEGVKPNQPKSKSFIKIEDGLSHNETITQSPRQNLKILQTWRPLFKKQGLGKSNFQISENSNSNNSSGGGENVERNNCSVDYNSSNTSKIEEKVNVSSNNNIVQDNLYDHLITDTTYPSLADDLQSLLNADKSSSTYIIDIPPIEMVSLSDLHTVHNNEKSDAFKVKENKEHTPSLTDSKQAGIGGFPSLRKTCFNSTGIDPRNENVSQIRKYESTAATIMKSNRKTLQIKSMLNVDMTNMGQSTNRVSPQRNRHSSHSSFLDDSKTVSNHRCSNFSFHSDGSRTISNECQYISQTNTALTRVTFKLPATEPKRRNTIKKRFKLKNPTVTKSISFSREPDRIISTTSQASSWKSKKSLTLHRRRQKSEMMVKSQRSLTSRVWSQCKYSETEREREYAQRKTEILKKIRKSTEKRHRS